MDGLALHRHEVLGFELRAPSGWRLLDESEHGLVVGAPSGESEGEFVARVAVAVEAVEPGADLAAVTTRALSSQARAAGTPVRLVDRLAERVGSFAAERVVLHCEVESHAVTVEEWRLLAGGRLVAVSAACATAAYDGLADDFGRVARSLRVDGSGLPPGVPGPLFDPATGLVVVTDAGFDALRALAAGRSPEAGAGEQLEALIAVGAIVDGRPHPTLTRALAPTTAPLLALSLVRAQATVRVWADTADASVLVPVGDQGWRRLVHGRCELLADTLAGLVGLRPTTAPPGRQSVTLPAPALARLVASEQDDPLRSTRLADISDQARTALAGVRDHWRIEAHRPGAGGGEAWLRARPSTASGS